jgi:hypothetical protein
MLPVVLCGSETWSLTLREEHTSRPKVFENGVLRRIFGPKRDEIIEGRNLHIEELHNLCSLLNIIRMIKSVRIRRAGHAARMGEKMRAYRVWVGKPGGRYH